MSELKPCPFCGNIEWVKVHQTAADMFYVGCEACDYPGPPACDEVEAIERWNRRKEKEGTDDKPSPK